VSTVPCAENTVIKKPFSTIWNNDGKKKEEFVLDSPDKCLILEPTDWHKMYNFSPDAILMVLASEYFDYNDYIFEEYAE
jgi:WxcM-like, C-terminal